MRSPDPKRPPAEEADDALSPEEEERLAFLKAEADRAIQPYVGLFPDEVIAAFRDRALAYLTADPQMVRLIDVALAKSGTQGSAVRPVSGQVDEEPGNRQREARKKT